MDTASAPETFGDIISLWPSAEALASDLGQKGVTVRAWKMRNTLPNAMWEPMVASAQTRKIEGVTLELLASIASKKAMILFRTRTRPSKSASDNNPGKAA